MSGILGCGLSRKNASRLASKFGNRAICGKGGASEAACAWLEATTWQLEHQRRARVSPWPGSAAKTVVTSNETAAQLHASKRALLLITLFTLGNVARRRVSSMPLITMHALMLKMQDRPNLFLVKHAICEAAMQRAMQDAGKRRSDDAMRTLPFIAQHGDEKADTPERQRAWPFQVTLIEHLLCGIGPSPSRSVLRTFGEGCPLANPSQQLKLARLLAESIALHQTTSLTFSSAGLASE